MGNYHEKRMRDERARDFLALTFSEMNMEEMARFINQARLIMDDKFGEKGKNLEITKL